MCGSGGGQNLFFMVKSDFLNVCEQVGSMGGELVARSGICS